YPSFGNMGLFTTPESYAPIAALNTRYVPVLQRITAAGWHPVTRARSSDADVWLERWGPGEDGSVYLTVYNAATEQRTATITVEVGELGLEGGSLTWADELSDAAGRAQITGGVASVELVAAPDRLAVLRLAAE
ncbi:MAG TPA: hypothetical protein VM283_01155, partial [Armatimonadota bacterium]|nr:hypothetical protein [Armatimonadota bacterium]